MTRARRFLAGRRKEVGRKRKQRIGPAARFLLFSPALRQVLSRSRFSTASSRQGSRSVFPFSWWQKRQRPQARSIRRHRTRLRNGFPLLVETLEDRALMSVGLVSLNGVGT